MITKIYIVEKKQAYTIINDEYVEIPNSFATYRTDTNDILTRTGKTVSKSYNVIQNKEAFEFKKEFI